MEYYLMLQILDIMSNLFPSPICTLQVLITLNATRVILQFYIHHILAVNMQGHNT